MNKIYLSIILGIIALNLVSAVPRIEPYVNDFVGVLNEAEKTQLNVYIDTIEKNTSYEIAIIIVNNTEGQDRLEYANRIGDENGVGKKNQDNGLVILWSMENDKL